MFKHQFWNQAITAVLCALGMSVVGWSQEPRKYSDDWWAMKSADPPGTRQVERFGKVWPIQPRPTGPSQHWVHAYHHAHYWPSPYSEMDQSLVRQALQLQAASGWQIATTMGECHFNPETHDLNSAGLNHLHWIAASANPDYRVVYVAQTMNPALDQLRVARVQQRSMELTGGQGLPVVLRIDQASSRPAVETDLTRKMELQSMPKPRLNFTVGSSGGSGSGAASGGGAASGSGVSSSASGPK